MTNLTNAVRTFRSSIAHWGVTEYALLIAVWGGMSVPLYLVGWGLLSVLSLPLFLASIVGLTLLAHRVIPSAPALSNSRSHIIEFTSGTSAQQHGTLSHIDGITRMTWTIHSKGTQSSTDGAISEGEFRAIWDMARFTHQLKAFKMANSDQAIDLNKNFLISVAFTDSGETYFSNYLVPHACTLPTVVAWIKRIQGTCPANA